MSLFEAIVLGIVQGLTEFLPISSTGHLRIVPAFVGWDDPGPAFTAVIQLGTTVAVLIYFREDLWRIARAWLRSLRRRTLGAREERDAPLGWDHGARHEPDRDLRARLQARHRARRAVALPDRDGPDRVRLGDARGRAVCDAAP